MAGGGSEGRKIGGCLGTGDLLAGLGGGMSEVLRSRDLMMLVG
jgi:hypothetical protein